MICMFAQNKGGVGKTTLVAHSAVYLHDQGKRVALLDCDKSASSSSWVSEVEKGIKVVHVVDPTDTVEALSDLRKSHDYVICDSPGDDNKTIRILMMVSDLIVFPVGPSILEVRALASSIATFKQAQKHRGGNKPEGKIVCNMVKLRGKSSKELPMAAKSFGVPVAKNNIRLLEAFMEAPKQGTVVTRMGLSLAMVDIEDLFHELFGIVPAALRGRAKKTQSNDSINNRVAANV